MKLTRLTSTTQRATRESIERLRPVSNERIRRVETMEGIEGDRLRTLQQEMAEIEPGALPDLRNAVAQLLQMEVGAGSLIKPGVSLECLIGIDDSV